MSEPVDLHCVVAGPGDGPPVLLAGSLGSTLAMWDAQVAALSARGRRVIALDHRGHGRSPAPPGPYAIEDLGGDALALMDRLGLRHAAYVGLSIGGMVGQWLAVHAPERLSALVVVCSSAHLEPADPWRERAAAVRAAGSPEIVADAVVARWFTSSWAADHPEEVVRCRAMIAATSAEGYAGCCEAIAGHDVRAGLPEVRVPTLVIGGAQDLSIPAEHSVAIAAAVPGARLEILDPAAHLPSIERADAVTSLIDDHLRTGVRVDE